MLHLDQFDLKTGKPIQVELEGRLQTALKPVAHSYLEHWLVKNGIDAQFSVAQFYENVNDADRLRLEGEGKFLAFASGGEGYFTDRETAQMIALGNNDITPIFAGDRFSPHNRVAYGSLISSDGVASTQLPTARILVVDNVNGSHGEGSLTDWNGEALSSDSLQRLYDKMGDGTMLVRPSIMASLTTPEESNRAFEAAGVSADIAALGQGIEQLEAATVAAEKTLREQSNQRVSQFRAATSLPGMAKGTMTASQWAERLKVDAIISTDDIKGDDGRFSNPGIQEVTDLWINRKSDGRYAAQSVGPQVKYTIPKATELEINPKIQEKAASLALVAGDLDALSQHYVEQKQRGRGGSPELLDDGTAPPQAPDWLYDVLSADRYGQMAGEGQTVRQLRRHVQGEWKKLAENGISVPSAVAQPHSQLKPWEVCNKDLLNGAIVAYYRSPFPNVSAAAIAINNTEVLRENDKEAFDKDGAAYLPPWTAKEIAITDFDGDRNGFFVGYEATVADLPQQIRAELASISSLSPDQQYEAGRALFERMIQQVEQGQESRLTPSKYPLAVKEFIEETVPDVKPPQINKQKKEKHPWQEGESQSAATWQAWGITADNPVGMVANAGMTLQALSLEMQYAPPEKREALVRQHSAHFEKLLEKVEADEISIPSDDWLVSQGFSPFYEERITDIAEVGKQLDLCASSEKRNEFVEEHSQNIASFLSDIANGPNALNLQTAVDMAKSSKGIDQPLHDFVVAIQCKGDAFRYNKDNAQVYGNKAFMPMPINMEEPVSWNVRSVNASYAQACTGLQLEERQHAQFRNILPGRAPKQLESSLEQTRIDYDRLVKTAARNKGRLKRRLSADQQPTMQVRSPSGAEFLLQEISDEKRPLPIWRAEGTQPDWTITVTKDTKTKSERKRFPAQLTFADSQGHQSTQSVGFISPESAEKLELEDKLFANKRLSVASPTVTLQVPYARENDADMLYAQTDRCVQKALMPPEGQDPDAHRQAVFTEFWGAHFEGRKIVVRHGTDVICDRLKSVSTKLSRVQGDVELVADGPRTVRFTTHEFVTKKQERVQRDSVEIAESNGEFRHLGYVANDKERVLPPGRTFMASFESVASAKGEITRHVVSMNLMELPTIEQSKAEMDAFQDGRRHLTFSGEDPYSVYGVRAGDIAIAQAPEGGKQIALQIKDQHPIDEQLVAKPGSAERWAIVEQSSPALLSEKLAAAQNEGKKLWGLNVQPLGTYVRGQVVPFKEPAQTQQTAAAPAPAIQPEPDPSRTQQPAQEKTSAALEPSVIESDKRIEWAKSIAPVVRLAHRELSGRDQTDQVETKHYLIGLDRERGELLLRVKDDGTELARFSWQRDKVIAADGLRLIDFERFTQNRQRLEDAIEARSQEKEAGFER